MKTPELDARPRSALVRALWLGAGLALCVVGVVGLVLPLLPGTVFLILAAACFARSSPRLESWLLAHPRFGPTIVAWRRDGVIPARAKALAFGGMAVSIVTIAASGAPPAAVLATAGLIAVAALYIASRPSRAAG